MTRLRRPTAREVLAGAMLGVGAILGPKANPEDHWSVSPKLRTDILVISEASGRGDGPDLDLDPPPMPVPRRRGWFFRRRGAWRGSRRVRRG